MPGERQYAVLGPLQSGVATRAFLGVELVDGESSPDRPVGVVWLPDEVVADPRQLARLQRETAFVTQLHHANLITVHGLVHFEEGWARLVEYVDGEPLSRVLHDARAARRDLPPELIARIIVDVCEGVQHAHEEGMSRFNGRAIVHGGIRPDTLMLGFDGRIRVTGYGAAVLAPTANGAPTPEIYVYLAPEQILGGRATASPATDVYAIGAVMLELMTGKPPFADAEDVENAILAEPPPAVEADAGAPLVARLGAIASRALAKRGPDRYESIDALKEAVLGALAEEAAVLPGSATLAAFIEALIPPDAPERVGRRALLASAKDQESVTRLTPLAAVGFDAGRADASAAAELLKPASLPAAPPLADDEAITQGRVAVSDLLDPGDGPGEDGEALEEPPGDEPTPVPRAPTEPTVPQVEVLGPTPDPRAPTEPAATRWSRNAPEPAPPLPPVPPSGHATEPTGAGVHGLQRGVPATQPKVPTVQSGWAAPQPPRVAPRSNPGQVALADPRLENPPVAGLPPPRATKRSSPIREESASISFFNRRAGDGSRFVFGLVVVAAFGLLAFIFLFPKAPPEGLDQPSERTRLPPELVKEALSRAPGSTAAPGPASPAGAAGPARSGPAASSGPARSTEPAASPGAARSGLAASPGPGQGSSPAPAADAGGAPMAREGTIVLQSDPVVSVYVGDKGYGRTPVTMTLPEGRHRVRLTDAATSINAYRVIRIRPDQRIERSFTFGTCRLRVDAPDGAVIKLNARVLGTAPLGEQTIYEGRYLLRVSYEGAVWSERFDAPPGGRLTYTVRLKDAPL